MRRAASLFAVVLLVAATGCRSAAPVTPSSSYGAEDCDQRDSVDSETVHRPAPTVAAARPVVFIDSQSDGQNDGDDVNAPSDGVVSPESLTRSDSSERLLSLADIESIAFENNPTLRAAAGRMDAARGREVQAGLYPNPVVGYQGMEMGNQDSAGQQGAFVSQRIITGGKLQLDQAIARKDFDAAHFRFHAQQQRVLSDVRIRFYDALAAQQRVALTTDLARIGDDLATATGQLLEGRLVSENDLLQAEIKADEIRILHDNARNEQLEAWRRLAAVAGIPAAPITTLAGELDANLPDVDWETCRAVALDGNPELSAARKRVERASAVAQRARQEPIPNIEVSASVLHHNLSQDDIASVQIGIPLPIFDRNQGAIQGAESDWRVASNEVERLELELQDRLAVAYRRFANARQQVDRYGKRMTPRAEKSLKIVTEGYEKGQVEYLTLLTAQQTYLQVKLAYLDSLRELQASWAAIEGQLLTDNLTVDR